MKKLLLAMMLSASVAGGLAGTALAATSGQAPPAAAQPSRSDAGPASNPMSGGRMTADGMMADRGGQGGTMRPMMAMMRMMTMMMGTGPNMAGHLSGSPMMGGSAAGAAGTHSPSR